MPIEESREKHEEMKSKVCLKAFFYTQIKTITQEK
jgi:hypothetical protein